MPEFNEIADSLEVHPQTLRRRFAAEGTTFKDIKNQLRRNNALHYLHKQDLSIEEIAYRAGFSESSAFIRAFKGWIGTTPNAYRTYHRLQIKERMTVSTPAELVAFAQLYLTDGDKSGFSIKELEVNALEARELYDSPNASDNIKIASRFTSAVADAAYWHHEWLKKNSTLMS